MYNIIITYSVLCVHHGGGVHMAGSNRAKKEVGIYILVDIYPQVNSKIGLFQNLR